VLTLSLSRSEPLHLHFPFGGDPGSCIATSPLPRKVVRQGQRYLRCGGAAEPGLALFTDVKQGAMRRSSSCCQRSPTGTTETTSTSLVSVTPTNYAATVTPGCGAEMSGSQTLPLTRGYCPLLPPFPMLGRPHSQW